MPLQSPSLDTSKVTLESLLEALREFVLLESQESDGYSTLELMEGSAGMLTLQESGSETVSDVGLVMEMIVRKLDQDPSLTLKDIQFKTNDGDSQPLFQFVINHLSYTHLGGKPLLKWASELISRGIDVNHRNESYPSVLESAMLCGQEDLCKKLIASGVHLEGGDGYASSSLFNAVMTGNNEIVGCILDRMRELNMPITQHQDLLTQAIGFTNDGMLDLLLQSGCDVNESGNDFNRTTLSISALYNHYYGIEQCLRYGARINEVDILGQSALHLVVASGELKIIELLVTRGIDIHLKTAQGKTATDIARDANNEATVHYLEAVSLALSEKRDLSELTEFLLVASNPDKKNSVIPLKPRL